MRLIDDRERRARLARRHGLAPQHRRADVLAATRAMAVLHSTEPATPYLSLFARIEGFARADYDEALFESRSLVRQLAMRRTLFVFSRELLPAAVSSASARIAEREHGRLVRELQRGELAADGAAWLATARAAILRRLAGGVELSAKQLREELDELTGQLTWYEGKPYGGVLHVAPQVLAWLSANGDVVRGRNAGHWRITRPQWTRMDEWLGAPVDRIAAGAGYAELVAAYLRTFGPVTERDLVWWFGATKAAMRKALADLAAVQVRLEREQTGWVLPDDVDPAPPIEPWAALLPVLDPTVMGWKDRDFYLDPDFVPAIFDRAGNCGTTAWWDGRIVGAYVQDEDGRVEVIVPADPGPAGRAALRAEADRLTEWLDGERVTSLYKSPLTTWERPASGGSRRPD
ncbi:winged helix DNA-binding domain-containing protein [Kitasatospora sp. NPDC049285]|uniref:winged helix DNA-binding domain-containing protein n=1 Tax=Kitasatospora sp. NPDC049285 TaxID=3157096 RepID=UPI00342C4B07